MDIETPLKHEPYDLYLEGLANELMHLLQSHRKACLFEIMDMVDVWLVQSAPDRLTSSIYQYIDTIVERIRIVKFYPKPPDDENLVKKSYTFTCSLGHKYTFDVYMRKVSDG